MKIPEIVREYVPTAGELRKLKAVGYSEISYIDRRTDGTPAGEGTEDFSLARWNGQHFIDEAGYRKVCGCVCRFVYCPTGELDKGGHRRWEYDGKVIARTVRECGIIARLRYTGQEISIRQY